jgi:hypothetical protein
MLMLHQVKTTGTHFVWACTQFQLTHALQSILCVIYIIEFPNNILQSDTDETHAQLRRNYVLQVRINAFILVINKQINTVCVCVCVCFDQQRFPLRWQPSRWLSVEGGRKQTLRGHFGIAIAWEWAGSFAATVGCFQHHELMDPIFLFCNRKSMFLLVDETFHVSVHQFLLPCPILIKLNS